MRSVFRDASNDDETIFIDASKVHFGAVSFDSLIN